MFHIRRWLFALAFMLAADVASAQIAQLSPAPGVTVYSIAATGSFTIPAWAKAVRIEVIGGGGGGGKGAACTSAQTCSGGGGGGGGGYCDSGFLPASTITSALSITVGTGGADRRARTRRQAHIRRLPRRGSRVSWRGRVVRDRMAQRQRAPAAAAAVDVRQELVGPRVETPVALRVAARRRPVVARVEALVPAPPQRHLAAGLAVGVTRVRVARARRATPFRAVPGVAALAKVSRITPSSDRSARAATRVVRRARRTRLALLETARAPPAAQAALVAPQRRRARRVMPVAHLAVEVAEVGHKATVAHLAPVGLVGLVLCASR